MNPLNYWEVSFRPLNYKSVQMSLNYKNVLIGPLTEGVKMKHANSLGGSFVRFYSLVGQSDTSQ